jgi:AraC-like DNA-binding protein
MKAVPNFEPHLVISEMKLPRTAEWTPNFRSWSFIQVRSGISYWQQANEMKELTEGSTLVLTGRARGRVRASQLSEVQISYFCLEPEKLTGLLSLSEQYCLKRVADGEKLAVRMLPAADPISERFKGMSAQSNGSPSTRLQLLQLFIDLFKGEMAGGLGDQAQDLDSLGRLRLFLKETVGTEFTEFSLSDLAPKMRCSPRHLSRLFRREMGMSFREKQTELRLTKACELLATSNAKVVDVAVTSGFQSNSLFSLMFKKHFGVSPGKWREQNTNRSPRRQKFTRMLPV